MIPCPSCGASIAAADVGDHDCNAERRFDFELFQLRDEVADLGVEIGDYPVSAGGRFEAWQAERGRSQRYSDEPVDANEL